MIVYKRFGYPQRTLSLSVRVGMTRISDSHGLVEITANKHCGDTSGSSTSSVSTVNCVPETHARYMTLQSKAKKEINIGEVNVFVASR